jgi:hypothetical protein
MKTKGRPRRSGRPNVNPQSKNDPDNLKEEELP